MDNAIIVEAPREAVRIGRRARRRRLLRADRHRARPARPERRRARPRRCASSPRSCSPTAAAPRCSASTSTRDPQAVRERIGLAGQYAAVDENLTGHENLRMVGQLSHLVRRRSRARGRRAARALRPHRRRRPARAHLLAAACAAGSTSRPRSCTARRCCSSTSRPPGSTRRAAPDLWGVIEELVADGTTRAAHDAVPRRGRPPRRQHRRDRPRPRDRRGHVDGAQGRGSAPRSSRSGSPTPRPRSGRGPCSRALGQLRRRVRRPRPSS